MATFDYLLPNLIISAGKLVKNRHSLLEVGIVLFISGLSMIMFPSIYEKSVTQHYSYPENIYTGIILMIVGCFLLLIKYYNARKNKNNNDNT